MQIRSSTNVTSLHPKANKTIKKKKKKEKKYYSIFSLNQSSNRKFQLPIHT